MVIHAQEEYYNHGDFYTVEMWDKEQKRAVFMCLFFFFCTLDDYFFPEAYQRL